MKTRSTLLLAAALCLPLRAFAADTLPDYVPMKIVQTDAAIFPSAAREIGLTEGEAHVMISVDQTGRLTDALLSAYSHPAFGEAALSIVKRWHYEPAYVHGQPNGAIVNLDFQYESHGVVVVNLDIGTYVEQMHYRLNPGSYAFRASTLRELDRIPTPTKVVRPVNAIAPSHTQTDIVTVTILFFIDETGHVRMPSVDRETALNNNQLAAAALNAVAQWEFEPPMSRGRPTLVEIRQDFNFHIKR